LLKHELFDVGQQLEVNSVLIDNRLATNMDLRRFRNPSAEFAKELNRFRLVRWNRTH